MLFVLGYVMQMALINPFIARPEHTQFLLMVAIAIIIVNGLLIVFGPDAQSVQTSYAFDSFAIGPLIVDATKLYAGARGDRGGGARCSPSSGSRRSARRSAPAPTTTPARWWSGSTSSSSMR